MFILSISTISTGTLERSSNSSAYELPFGWDNCLMTFKEGTPRNALSTQQRSSAISLHQLLALPQEIELKLKKIDSGFQNFTTEYYETYFNGYLIDGGEYRIQYKENNLISDSGKKFFTELKTTQPPKISAKNAFESAQISIGASKYAWEMPLNHAKLQFKKPADELVSLPIEQGDKHSNLILAYKFDLFALQPLSRDHVYIDAETGLILKKHAILKHLDKPSSAQHRPASINVLKKSSVLETGNAATRYSGTRAIQTSVLDSTYILNDVSRGLEISTVNLNNRTDYGNVTEFRDMDNEWTAAEFHNANKDDVALDVHWG